MAALMYNVSRGFVIFGEYSLLLKGHKHQILVNSRRYVRALRRRPVAVLYPDGEREKLIKSNEAAYKMNEKLFTQKDKHREKVSEKAGNKKWSGHVSECADESPNIKDKLGGLRFEKAPPGDNRLAKVASVARSRAFREKEGKVLLEGRRLICDALSAGASPQTLFFSAVERLQELPLDKLQQAKLIKVRYEDMKMWSDLVTPQGVIGCVDAWEPKVLRAAMGAHFRLPVFPNLDWDEISKHLPKDVVVHVADNSVSFIKAPVPGQRENGSSDEYSDSDSDEESDDELSLPCLKSQVYYGSWAQRNTALVIGGETHGLSLEARRLAEETEGKRLFVPMAPGVESLNSAMAASVLLFEGRRQLLQLLDKRRRRTRSKII
ncbi:rRNA methyltransferase mitochondrial [Labeo rohita]|uniref:rRNA methyltransferase mitochondrial n=1 Tax=Labeo rohita TaxID=84645 RepID=A0A498L6K8_LABRO|nr:rRNA methyltransferase mitochondrial [Labeo rohita]